MAYFSTTHSVDYDVEGTTTTETPTASEIECMVEKALAEPVTPTYRSDLDKLASAQSVALNKATGIDAVKSDAEKLAANRDGLLINISNDLRRMAGVDGVPAIVIPTPEPGLTPEQMSRLVLAIEQMIEDVEIEVEIDGLSC